MKFKRFMCLVSCAVILFSVTACSKEKEDETTTVNETTVAETTKANVKKYVVKTQDGDPLNMRSGAGTNFNIITRIPNGTELIITEEENGWGFTLWGNYQGWVSLNYLNESVVNADDNSTTSSSNKESTASTSKTDNQSTGYAYSYAGFNPTEIEITDSNWQLVLVNRNYILKEGYKPKLKEAVAGSGQYLDYRVAPYYQKMYDAAKKDGVTLSPCSGYRSYETQKNNFQNKINLYTSQGYDKVTATQNAARVILPPGTSEHNAGLAMDIGWVTEDFENSSAFAWLNEHAQDYGFIMRYPKSEDKQAITEIIYEPWHWRYVGVEVAKELKESGQVLEEYLGK